MSLRTSIHACLLAAPDVTALIGVAGTCRHYPERAPQGVLSDGAACVISSEIAANAFTTHGIAGDAEDTLDESLVQFTCLAETVAVSLAVRAAVRAAFMDDAGGILAAAHIVVTAPTERFSSADEINRHGAQLDLTFFHNPRT